MTSAFDLSGKLAVVTGASRGLGLAMAGALATAGADILGISSTLSNGPSEVKSLVESHGRRFEGMATNFADTTEVEALADALDDREVDILVNNAGTIARAPASEHPIASWNSVMTVNLTSQFILTQAVGRKMTTRGHGKVIFTASLLSFQGGINVPGYTAAKSGLAGLTRALANEWMSQGINVNAIAPGYFATDNTKALREDPERSRSILDRIPAGRWGEPSDIGGATVFLASEASDYVSGVVLAVDGGWLAR